MSYAGGCYCGAVRYRADGEPLRRAICLCRECTYITGGGPNYVMAFDAANFTYTHGAPSGFARPDLDTPRSREFCATCGTHVALRSPDGSRVMVKVGTLDDPAVFGTADAVIYIGDRQPYHLYPTDAPGFDGSSR